MARDTDVQTSGEPSRDFLPVEGTILPELFMLARQRERDRAADADTEPCPACKGEGSMRGRGHHGAMRDCDRCGGTGVVRDGGS